MEHAVQYKRNDWTFFSTHSLRFSELIFFPIFSCLGSKRSDNGCSARHVSKPFQPRICSWKTLFTSYLHATFSLPGQNVILLVDVHISSLRSPEWVIQRIFFGQILHSFSTHRYTFPRHLGSSGFSPADTAVNVEDARDGLKLVSSGMRNNGAMASWSSAVL